MTNPTTFLISIVLTLLFSPCTIAQRPKLPQKEEVLIQMRQVADWQLANHTKKRSNSWDYAPFYMGLMELHHLTGENQYWDALYKMGEKVKWETLPRPYDANSLAISQVFLEMFEKTGDTAMIKNSRYVMDTYLMRWLKPDVSFEGNKHWYEWWSWCDALYMAPPAFARASMLLDEPKYMDKADELWWITSDHLFSENDSLIFRDDRFFEKRTKNDKKVYWSRGNGWVFSGITRVLDYLPSDYSSRDKYEEQFKQMAYKLKSIQQKDGFWGQSLLDVEEFPQKESSGTAFFVQGIAWGMNNDLLPKEDFLPVVSKGWNALQASLHQDGKFGNVQKVGHEPTEVSFEDSESYGSGAFLLAGRELYQLLKK